MTEAAHPRVNISQVGAVNIDDGALPVRMADGHVPSVTLDQIDGVDVATSAPGVQAVGGPAAHGSAPVGGPVIEGFVATAADPVAVAEGRTVRGSANLTGYQRVMADVFRLAGIALAAAPAGALPVAPRGRVVVATASIIDDGAGAPVALADAYAAIGAAGSSAWIDLDSACADVALILDTADATPAYVELELLWSRQLAAAPPTGYFSESIVSSVDGSAEYLARRLTRWYGHASAVLPVSPPSRRYVVERPPEAVSYCVRARRGSAVAVTAQLWATQVG